MGSLFITGASGFIGRRLLARLNFQRYDHVYGLTRRETTIQPPGWPQNFHWLIGSVFDSHVYGGCLDSNDVVVHLAATTGKARREQYFTVNSTGTRYLLAQCKQKGVKHFLYVSSIAVKYEDKSHYYYAQSKQEGEEAVKQSGLNYTILRPTIVLGKESPGWNALSKLARLPFVIVFGNGTARMQPIDVDDLADAIVSVVEERRFFNETLEIGGPDVVSMEEFLKNIHWQYYSKKPKAVYVPVKTIRTMVAFLEKYFRSLMPINAGQLSVFLQDSTITSNPLYEERRSKMRDLDTVLQALTRQDRVR